MVLLNWLYMVGWGAFVDFTSKSYIFTKMIKLLGIVPNLVGVRFSHVNLILSVPYVSDGLRVISPLSVSVLLSGYITYGVA